MAILPLSSPQRIPYRTVPLLLYRTSYDEVVSFLVQAASPLEGEAEVLVTLIVEMLTGIDAVHHYLATTIDSASLLLDAILPYLILNHSHFSIKEFKWLFAPASATPCSVASSFSGSR